MNFLIRAFLPILFLKLNAYCLPVERGYYPVKEVLNGPLSGNAKEIVNFISDLEPDMFLLTYPKSGTNLTTGLIQTFTLKPLTSPNNYIHYMDANRLNLNLDFEKTPFLRTHKGYLLKNKKGKLLLVLRNYKEAIIRSQQQKFLKALNQGASKEFFKKSFSLYLENLKIYHDWDSNNKLLIYYEDLVLDPFVELNKILFFMGEKLVEDDDRYILEDAVLKIRDLYHLQFINEGGSVTKGNKNIFHSRTISKKKIGMIDKFIKEEHSDLWIYLNRYEAI